MMLFSSVDEIFDFAIAAEEEAERFYTDLAAKVETEDLRKAFLEFAGEERGHKAKLQAAKQGKTALLSSGNVPNLKIADYQTPAVPSKDMDMGDALLLAMQKEKTAFKLYTDLAAAADDPKLKNLFSALAQEEAKHKLRFELEYDRGYLSEN